MRAFDSEHVNFITQKMANDKIIIHRLFYAEMLIYVISCAFILRNYNNKISDQIRKILQLQKNKFNIHQF